MFPVSGPVRKSCRHGAVGQRAEEGGQGVRATVPVAKPPEATEGLVVEEERSGPAP
jgi:hypothetical protein